MPFRIIRNDITKVEADAIVNTANPKVAAGRGTDYAIYEAAGKEQLMKSREAIGVLERGQAAYTPAFALPAKYIIHTAGPSWVDGNHGEEEILSSCYRNSLAIAEELKCESVAFPLIATGNYGFPKDRALHIAIREISSFLTSHDMTVILTVFDDTSFSLSGKIFEGVQAYIDSEYVQEAKKKEYHASSFFRRREKEARRPERPQSPHVNMSGSIFEEREDEELSTQFDTTILTPEEPVFASRPAAMPYESAMEDIDAIAHSFKLPENSSFQAKLFELIDERHLEDKDVYKRANIDRKLFSKIRCSENYLPKKNTVLALAIALELDIKETEDLLARADHALNPGNLTDVIVRYFIESRYYNMIDIEMTLYEYTRKTLTS